ncbi:transporter substrate-binding domain-containing protein [Aestuariibacter sp. AA17]|uniref:Transporter substrate-binding domain-containing protein n=1 Tax=Fluctibacter corallii TaxID=2984329 RepID=A0ABT3ACG9_9ALTE|nr:transporter substrate-binding domain-containing protein [Aestuariibacter sp. AA17]MCV2886277.1 transporter substrate-binding domain-containing protein [Aestuariibacter sp. AA17]
MKYLSVLINVVLLVVAVAANSRVYASFSVSPNLDKNVDIAVGWTKPPYVIADGNTGYELDLIRTVFASIGYDITPIYVPYGRSHSMLRKGLVDVTLTLNERLGIEPEKLSDVYVVYQNVAISLKKRNLHITRLEDLSNRSVVGFQDANRVLGEEYRKAVEKAYRYVELPEQRRQVEMLLLGNADVVVMDLNIFLHVSADVAGTPMGDNINIHRLFPPNPYRAGFRSTELKIAFDVALRQFMSSEKYEWLKNKYVLVQPANLNQ